MTACSSAGAIVAHFVAITGFGDPPRILVVADLSSALVIATALSRSTDGVFTFTDIDAALPIFTGSCFEPTAPVLTPLPGPFVTAAHRACDANWVDAGSILAELNGSAR